MKIVVVGSINMDLVATVARVPALGETVLGERFQTFPGGKGANQAVAAARLGRQVTPGGTPTLGSSVALIGRLGRDGFAPELRAGLEAEGIDTRGVTHVPGSSGTAVITVTADGANTIIVTLAANATLLPEDLEAYHSVLRDADIVLAQLETPLPTVERLAAMCADAGVPLMLDPAPAQPLSASLLRHVTWLTPNETETAVLLNEPSLEPAEAASRLLATGVRNVVLKLGERGVYLAGHDVAPTSIPAFRVMPLDTTAAGDCFNGAFAVALSAGHAAAEAARFACASAALSTTVAGAQPSMPGRDAVQRLMAEQK